MLPYAFFILDTDAHYVSSYRFVAGEALITKPLIKIIMKMIDLNKVLRIALVILFLVLSTLPAY